MFTNAKQIITLFRKNNWKRLFVGPKVNILKRSIHFSRSKPHHRIAILDTWLQVKPVTYLARFFLREKI